MRNTFTREPPNNKIQKKSMFSTGEADDIKQRFYSLFNNSRYKRYRDQWEHLRDTQLPYTGDFLDDGEEYQKGNRPDRKSKDGTAWRANLTFAGGMASGLTPQSVQWFKFAFSDNRLDDFHEAKVVLDERLGFMNKVFSNTNFYNATHANYLELAYGQAPLGIFADSVYGVRFEPYPIGSYAYDVDEKGQPFIFGLKKKMTARTIASKFGEQNLPSSVLDALKDKRGYKKDFTVCWLVEKNNKYDYGKLGSEYLPYISLYWIKEDSDKNFIRVSGFDSFPIALARYHVIGQDAYGYGPAWYADGDNRMLFKMLLESFTNMELFSRPPLQAPGSMEIDYRPGGVTRNVQSSQGQKVETLFNIHPIFIEIFALINEQRESINRAYNVNLFTMLDQNAMDKQGRTAYELALRNQEKMQQLGPVVERQNSEYLNAIIQRAYSILEKGGALPPFPDEVLEQLEGEEIKIEYVSPLAQAQKMSSIEPIEMLVAFVGQIAQLDPNAIHLPEFTEIVYKYAESIGTEAKLLKSREQYAEIITAQQEKVQQEEEMAQLMAGAQPAQQYTQAAANLEKMAQQEGNPALDQLLQNTFIGGI